MGILRGGAVAILEAGIERDIIEEGDGRLEDGTWHFDGCFRERGVGKLNGRADTGWEVEVREKL